MVAVVTSVFVDGRAAFNRMGGFLLEEERTQYVVNTATDDTNSGEEAADEVRPAIEIKGAAFAHPSPVASPAYGGKPNKRKNINPALLMLALPLTPVLLLLYLLRAACCGDAGSRTQGKLVQRAEVKGLVEKLGRPITEDELDALMAYLRARPVEIPGLLLQPECVSIEVVRSKWETIATIATTEGAAITGPALRAAGALGSAPLVLQDLQLTIEQGSLVCVVGAVGAGKSSLLLGLLGEMELRGGSVSVAGKVCYAGQSAFLSNATVRQNIVWDEEWDEEKYRRVVYACALTADLQALPAGDDTQIGERGVNLSVSTQAISFSRNCSDRLLVIAGRPEAARGAGAGVLLEREGGPAG